MKLATYKDGSRDGQLVVVSRDLGMAHYATGIAGRLQQALDDWNFLSPQLQDLYDALNHGRSRHAFPFDPTRCMAPLPRAGQWVEAVAYLSHLELVRGLTDRDALRALKEAPLMLQGAGDDFLGPCDEVRLRDERWGIDFGAGLAALTGDIPMGASPDQGLDGVRLLMLANGWSLRHLVEQELARGGGVLQGRPAAAFSPVAVTPDELGEAWSGGRIHLTLQVSWNGRKVGMGDAGDMGFHFGQLVAHLGRTRRIRAGAIIGSGPVSNPGATKARGRMEWPKGYSCIAERRAMEIRQDGQATTDYLKHGDTVRIEMKGRDGQSVFGAIEQTVVAG